MLDRIRRNRRFWVIGAACASVAIAFALTAVWRATRAVDNAREVIARESSFAFSTKPLDRIATPIEYLPAPAAFTDFAAFQGKLYVCSPSGLLAYDADGSLIAQFRTGELLPPAPLITAAVGLTGKGTLPELWIGTAGEGLVAYDGATFRHIRPSDARHRRITSILPLRTGHLLIGTERAGVLLFDGETLTLFHPTLRDLRVTALAGDETGVWIGTIDKGLMHWHGGRFDRFDESTGLPDPRILSIALRDGITFAGTAAGVGVIRNGKYERTIAEELFARALYPQNGRLLVGTQEDGVVTVDLTPARSRRPLDAQETSAPATVHRIGLVGDRVLAAGSDGFYTTSGERVLAPDKALLTDGNVSAIAVDSGGRAWVGYFDRGLDIVEPDFSRVRHLEDDNLFCVNRIVVRPDGNAAIATANGLVLFDAALQKRQVLGRDDGLIANHITDIAFAGNEMIVATPAGVSFLGQGPARSLCAFQGLVNNHVYAIGAAGGTVLAGTLGGVSVLERGLVRANYTTANSALRQNWITAIQKVGGDWLVGTYGAGVFKLDPLGGWHAFTEAGQGIEINPTAMHVTTDRVYAGTLGQGLLVYDRKSERWSRTVAGLPSLNVTAIASGGGYLLVGTDNGLVRWREGEQ